LPSLSQSAIFKPNVFEPFIGLGDGLALSIAQRVSLFLGRNHGLQQMNHGGELARAELIEQVMGVLYIYQVTFPVYSLLQCKAAFPKLVNQPARRYIRRACSLG